MSWYVLKCTVCHPEWFYLCRQKTQVRTCIPSLPPSLGFFFLFKSWFETGHRHYHRSFITRSISVSQNLEGHRHYHRSFVTRNISVSQNLEAGRGYAKRYAKFGVTGMQQKPSLQNGANAFAYPFGYSKRMTDQGMYAKNSALTHTLRHKRTKDKQMVWL